VIAFFSSANAVVTPALLSFNQLLNALRYDSRCRKHVDAVWLAPGKL
jgi:hypothetical protein